VCHRLVIGWGLAGVAFALLVTAIAGIAPWVTGTDPGCPDEGPSGLFLLSWVGSVGAAAAAIGCFLTSGAGRMTRWGGVSVTALVPLGAVVWFVVVVTDGIQDCGF
jgi:hypothetical protein